MTAIPLEEDEIEYPDSDGEPMAETEVHLEEMVYIRAAFKKRFQDTPDVYVAGNLLFYYEKGNREAVVAPDGFVVKGVPKGRRRNYLLWKEGKVPCFVAEVTSYSTKRKDLGFKKDLYERLGVAEYFLFDPLGEYLKPQLQGFRLVGRRYRPMSPGPDGSLVSTTTGVEFHHDGSLLRLTDIATGEPFLRDEEETAARRQAEKRAVAEAAARRQAEERAAAEVAARRQAEERAAAEVAARRQAEERVRALEEELARLRAARSQG
ncbi:MAG TPA: Uma2 family endonuclease [Thermoanaerobaculia bacterium]